VTTPDSALSARELLARIRDDGEVPRHIAIIMDGNGRWARARMMPRPVGHRAGMTAVRDVVEGAIEAGVEILSLFAFSQENWSRPADEVAALMSLLEEYIAREAAELAEKGVQVRFIGELDRLNPTGAAAVERITALTESNRKLTLNLFLSYGGRAEITRAARSLAIDAAAGRLDPSKIDEESLQSRLFTADMPDPDLLVRTSGELRISNFMLWQVAYAELFISPVLWPDFGRRELFEAIVAYQSRERRFGRVSV
jgi:undecaprenyl diphosphate synthase